MHFGGGGIQINILPVEDTISDLGLFFLVLIKNIFNVASQSTEYIYNT